MLVFPDRLRHGDVPNVDFLHLYGPFSLRVLAGWYWVFGYTLESQRAFGLVQHVALIAAAYALARAWGRGVAVVSAVTVTLLVITPIGLSALAWEGGIALAMWSIVFGVRALHTNGRARMWAGVFAGLLIGFALGFRPDLAVALALAHGWLVFRSKRWRPLLVGLIGGVIPMLVHMATAGLGPSLRGMVTDPVFKLRPGRKLPVPPSWGKVDGALQAVSEGPADAPWWRLPALSANHQLFIWFFVVIVVCVGVAFVAHRWVKVSQHPRFTALMAGALLGLGTMPQALQRPDSTHLAWGSCIAMALLPCIVAEFATRRTSRLTRHPALVSAAAVGALLLVVAPFYTFRTYLFHSRVSVGNKTGGFEVSRDGRDFYFGNAALQSASQSAIDELDRISQPGQRLLVGPADLSRTIYSDVVFYYLFPELEPATYYIEMDPGLADRPDSSLADDVASADWLLLTNFWTGWYEPNASSNFGSDAPNQVVAKSFCLVGNYEDALVLLYQRCDAGDGISPAGIGIGAERRASLESELAENS